MAISNIKDANETAKQNYLGLVLDWKITGEQTLGALAIVEALGSPGTEPPLHYHEAADEFFYIIDGDMTFKVGEEISRIGRSGFVWIPRTTIHGFVIHSETSKFLFGFVPAGLEQMFMAISTPLGTGTNSMTNAQGPATAPDTVDAHRGRYKTIVAGPPLRKFLADG